MQNNTRIINYPEDMGYVLEIGFQIRKYMRTSCRLLSHHPFFVAFLLFLTFLHRLFPFVFSLLVTASPVVVCSVTILGTLLIFGTPNLPKTKREKKITHGVPSLGTWSSRRNVRLFKDKFSRNSVDELSGSKYNSDPEDSVGYVPLIDETFYTTDGGMKEFYNKELDTQRVIHKKKLGTNGKTRDVKHLEKAVSLKSDHSESSQGGGGGNDEASDSGSEKANSMSPDASIADIFPILDELHPLLDVDAPLPVHMSPDDSGIESDRSNDGSNESDDEDTEIQSRGGEYHRVDDNDEDEDEAHYGKEDESKSAIKWTEDDQMNLRDLGNLELERNICLENLMTKRRTSQRDQKNLAELRSSENPFNITPISTRHNPFDHSYDSYDDMGLPPIPASAPSTNLQTRSPFYLCYEKNEGNSEFKVDHAEQQNVTFLPTNTIFCRHRSIGPSRQERQDLRWKPIFVPEQLVPQVTTCSSIPALPREASDSRLSTTPDTDSVSSGEDLDERKCIERDKEDEAISNIYQASDLVNHKSHFSEDLDPLQMEESEIQNDKSENGSVSLLSTEGLYVHVESITNPTHLGPEAFEEKSSNRSSSTLSSELDEEYLELNQDGSKVFEQFEVEAQTMNDIVDDAQHMPPVYDTSPTGSGKALSLNSVSSYIQGDISEGVTVTSSSEVRVPSAERTLYTDLHGESIKVATSENEQIGATSDIHDDVPRKLNVEVASRRSIPQFVASNDKMLAEEENFSLSSMSKDQPHFDNQDTLTEPEIVLLESKEDSNLKDVNAVETQDPIVKNLSSVSAEPTSNELIALNNKEFDAQETMSTYAAVKKLSEVIELPKPSNTKDGYVETGIDAVNSLEVVLSNTETTIQETVAKISSNQLLEANVDNEIQSSNVQDRSLEEVTSAANKDDASRNRETSVTTKSVDSLNLKEGSEDIDPPFHASSNSEDYSTKVGTKTSSPNQGSKANDHELVRSPSSKDGSTEFRTKEKGSTKEIESINTETSNSNDGSPDITNAMGYTKNVQDTTTNQEVSETNIGELPTPSNADDFTNKLTSRNTDVEVITTAAKQISEGSLGELPTASHENEESTPEVGTNAERSKKNLQEAVATHKEFSEANEELQNPSNRENESTKVPQYSEDTENYVAEPLSITDDGISRNTESSVQKSISSSKGDRKVELRRLNSEGHVGEGPKSSTSDESNTSEPKPINLNETNEDESKPEDVEESNAGDDSQKPPESKGWFRW